jgi:hypothetical protein
MIQAGQEVVLRERADRTKRLWFALYAGFVAVYSIAFGLVMARANGPYIIGEWLINYSGGFVRRGLIGSLVLGVSHGTGVPLVWVVFALQVLVFMVFLGCVYRLTAGIRWTYLMAAVLLSPATLAFTVMDSYAGLRKEFLLFATLAMVVCVLVFGRWRDWQLSLLLSGIAVGLALSHEALMVGGPYLLAAVVIQRGDLRRAVRICCIPVLVGVIAMLLVLSHPGNPAIAQAVCSAVGSKLGPLDGTNGNVCSGSIAWLQLNAAQARELVLPAIRQHHRVRTFGLLAIPTFVPLIAQLVLYWRRDRLPREVITVMCCAVLSLAGTVYLFLVAVDWGRWMHIQAVCLMLMVLMVDRRARAALSEPPPLRRRWVRYACTFAVVVYATTWTLPPTGRGDGQRGYVDVARVLHSMWRSGNSN